MGSLLYRIATRHGQISFERYVGAISEFTRITGDTPELVVFLYLDMMQRSAAAVRQLETMRSTDWVGILFHPRALTASQPVERYFSARNSRGGIFLVPSAVERYSHSLPDQKFIQVPDVADLEVATAPPRWITDLRSRAAARTVVLLVGSIAPQKGIVGFIEVVRLADPSRIFFAVVGEPLWDSFGDQREYVQSFFAKPPENVFTKFGYLESEADYNALICACDIIYAVYQGFNSSSNSLTKAAGFQRRILVADGTLMGQRVLEARIGDVAPETNPEAIHAALQRLAKRPATDFDFDVYAARHSLEALKKVLAEALPRWLNAADNAQEPTAKRTS